MAPQPQRDSIRRLLDECQRRNVPIDDLLAEINDARDRAEMAAMESRIKTLGSFVAIIVAGITGLYWLFQANSNAEKALERADSLTSQTSTLQTAVRQLELQQRDVQNAAAQIDRMNDKIERQSEQINKIYSLLVEEYPERPRKAPK